MKNILIAIHSTKIQAVIKKHIITLFHNCNIHYCNDYNSAIFTMINSTIDIFLVEDYIPYSYSEATMGFQLMAEIRKVNKYYFTPIFFFSNLEKSILYAYEEFHCFSCYEYPFNTKSLYNNLKIALKYKSPKELHEYIYFKKDGLLYPVSTNSILYIQCHREGTFLQCIQKSMQKFPYHSCKQILEVLDFLPFVQCNKSTIINKNHLKAVDLTNHIISLNYTEIAIELSSNYKNSVYYDFNLSSKTQI